MKTRQKEGNDKEARGVRRRWRLAEALRSAAGADDLLEWASFALLPDPGSRLSLRSIIDSYETYLVSEGLVPLRLRAFLCLLNALGLEVRGVTVRGARLHSSLPPLRLLTRLELYGFRFRYAGDRLAWRGPPSFSTREEQRVIDRNRRILVGALRQIEERHRGLRGEILPIAPVKHGRPPHAA